MRRSLGMFASALLLAATAGCGDDPSADDPPAEVDGAREPVTEVTQVAILTGTSAGGRVTTKPTMLPDDAAVRRYVERFRNDRLQGEIVRAADGADVPEGQRLAAAVVAVGCEVPTQVVGTGVGGEVPVHGVLPSAPTKQCLVPITSVALVLLPA